MNKFIIGFAVTVLVISGSLLISELQFVQPGRLYTLPSPQANTNIENLLSPRSMGNYSLQQPASYIPEHADILIRRSAIRYHGITANRQGFFSSNGRITGFRTYNPDFMFLNVLKIGDTRVEVEDVIGRPNNVQYSLNITFASYERENLIIEYKDNLVTAFTVHQSFTGSTDYLDFFTSISGQRGILSDPRRLNAVNIINPENIPFPQLSYSQDNDNYHFSIITESRFFSAISAECYINNQIYSFQSDIQPGFSDLLISVSKNAQFPVSITIYRDLGLPLRFQIQKP